MKKARQRPISRGMAEAKKRVDRWRGDGGGRGARMPEELWREATEVARADGVYATARALRLDYSRLKKRVTASQKATREGAGRAPTRFVELPLGQAGTGGKTTIELVSRGGDRLWVEIHGSPTVDVVGLAQEILSQRHDSADTADADSGGGRAG